MLIDRLDWIDGWPVVRAGAGPSDGPTAAPVSWATGGTFDAAACRAGARRRAPTALVHRDRSGRGHGTPPALQDGHRVPRRRRTRPRGPAGRGGPEGDGGAWRGGAHRRLPGPRQPDRGLARPGARRAGHRRCGRQEPWRAGDRAALRVPSAPGTHVRGAARHPADRGRRRPPADAIRAAHDLPAAARRARWVPRREAPARRPTTWGRPPCTGLSRGGCSTPSRGVCCGNTATSSTRTVPARCRLPLAVGARPGRGGDRVRRRAVLADAERRAPSGTNTASVLLRDAPKGDYTVETEAALRAGRRRPSRPVSCCTRTTTASSSSSTRCCRSPRQRRRAR